MEALGGGLLTPAFVTCSTNAGVRTSTASNKRWGEKASAQRPPSRRLSLAVLVLQVTNTGGEGGDGGLGTQGLAMPTFELSPLWNTDVTNSLQMTP